MIRVLLADDENLIRVALAQLLDLEDDLSVVAQAASGDEALAVAAKTELDVAVLDLQMPGADGIAVAEQLTRTTPQVASVIVTSHGRPGHLKRALAAGVRGFLPKTTSAATLAEVVRTVHAGGRHVDPELAAEAIAAGDSPAHAARGRRTGARRRRRAGGGDRGPGLAVARHRAQLPLQRGHEARRRQPARRLRDRAADGVDLGLAFIASAQQRTSRPARTASDQGRAPAAPPASWHASRPARTASGRHRAGGTSLSTAGGLSVPGGVCAPDPPFTPITKARRPTPATARAAIKVLMCFVFMGIPLVAGHPSRSQLVGTPPL